jgi:hypothetical protein
MPSTDSWPLHITVSTASQTIMGGATPVLASYEELEAHPLLSDSMEKLRWAERHLATLVHNIDQATVHADPENFAVLRAELDAKSGYHIFRIVRMPDMSELTYGFTHSIADVANPLRAALEKLAWQCAGWFGAGTPKDPPGVKFPITTSPAEWINAGRARNQLDPAHCGFIERFQPYNGMAGRADDWTGPYVHPLTLLQDLTNDDKHRDTQPVFLIPNRFHLRNLVIADHLEQLRGITFSAPDHSFPGIGKPMELGAEAMRARLINAEPEINDAGRVAPHIALPEGRGAVHTMQRLHRFVHLILSEFARDFPASLYSPAAHNPPPKA